MNAEITALKKQTVKSGAFIEPMSAYDNGWNDAMDAVLERLAASRPAPAPQPAAPVNVEPLRKWLHDNKPQPDEYRSFGGDVPDRLGGYRAYVEALQSWNEAREVFEANFGANLLQKVAAPAPAVGEAAPRPESGPMRFGNDWTGVFIRGDRAGAAAMQLRLVLRGAPVEHIGLEGIARLLESCDERTSTQEPQEAMLVAATPPTGEAERLREALDDVACRLDHMIRYRHETAHNGDIYEGGSYDICPLCKETREAIASARAALASPAPQPADGVTQAQHEIVASIIDMVEHDQSRRAEMNRLRADALRAVLARALASPAPQPDTRCTVCADTALPCLTTHAGRRVEPAGFRPCADCQTAGFCRSWNGGVGRCAVPVAATPAPQPAADGMRAAIQQWAIYCFNHHGDDAELYNGLAELGGVDLDGKGWIPPAAAPGPPVQCPNCGGMGETTHDILVAGTEHDTEQRECDVCKGTGLAAVLAPRAPEPAAPVEPPPVVGVDWAHGQDQSVEWRPADARRKAQE